MALFGPVDRATARHDAVALMWRFPSRAFPHPIERSLADDRPDRRYNPRLDAKAPLRRGGERLRAAVGGAREGGVAPGLGPSRLGRRTAEGRPLRNVLGERRGPDRGGPIARRRSGRRRAVLPAGASGDDRGGGEVGPVVGRARPLPPDGRPAGFARARVAGGADLPGLDAPHLVRLVRLRIDHHDLRVRGDLRRLRHPDPLDHDRSAQGM